MFNGCSNLTKIQLPNNLQSMGSSVFLICKKLKTITLPDSLSTMG